MRSIIGVIVPNQPLTREFRGTSHVLRPILTRVTGNPSQPGTFLAKQRTITIRHKRRSLNEVVEALKSKAPLSLVTPEIYSTVPSVESDIGEGTVTESDSDYIPDFSDSGASD